MNSQVLQLRHRCVFHFNRHDATNPVLHNPISDADLDYAEFGTSW